MTEFSDEDRSGQAALPAERLAQSEQVSPAPSPLFSPAPSSQSSPAPSRLSSPALSHRSSPARSHPSSQAQRLAAVLDPTSGPELIADGATWAEGPLWLPAQNTLIWSDIPGNRILAWSPERGQSVWRSQVEFTNGRALAPDGQSVLTCSHGRRAIERHQPDGQVTIVVDSWSGARLNSPNDIVVDRSGAIWFTDPPYGIVQPQEGHPGQREYRDNYVFRIDPTSGQAIPVVLDVEEPNGLAFSPDESVLYVTDTSAALRPEGQGNRLIRAYDVAGGRLAKNGRVFARMGRGLADGIAVDLEGNVWTSHGPCVSVIGSDGVWLGDIELPQVVGNLCFGGPDGSDLFIAATSSIYRLRTQTRGADLRWTSGPRGSA